MGGHLVPVRQSRFSNFFLTKMQDACKDGNGFLQRMGQKKEKLFSLPHVNSNDLFNNIHFLPPKHILQIFLDVLFLQSDDLNVIQPVVELQ